ncbi:MAG: YraN family protein [Rubrobacteraceae bacterium]
MNNRRTGARGEKLALRHLGESGYELVCENYRTRYGEIDLIVRDGETLVFVEVKLRRGTGYGSPLESVTPRKQEQIRAVAAQYLAETEPECKELRFDVVGILEGKGGPDVMHIKDAF